MRLLHIFDDHTSGEKFSAFLKHEGIDNVCETQTNTDWGSSDYGTIKCTLWIIEEDQLETAQRWLQEYEAHPHDSIFVTSERSHLLKESPFKNLKINKPHTLTPPQKTPLKTPTKKYHHRSYFNTVYFLNLHFHLFDR